MILKMISVSPMEQTGRQERVKKIMNNTVENSDQSLRIQEEMYHCSRIPHYYFQNMIRIGKLKVVH
jgi:hypothetical protein